MQPPTSIPPTKLLISTFITPYFPDDFKRRLSEVVHGAPAFNLSFLNGQYAEGSRIGGFDQVGDIIVRQHRAKRSVKEITIEYRAGDQELVSELIRLLGPALTPKAPVPDPKMKRPPGMAYFFEMINGNPLGKRVIIAEAAIEAAHDLSFEDYRSARLSLDILGRLKKLAASHEFESDTVKYRYRQSLRRHTNPPVCLHEGRKVLLRHRIDAIPSKDGRTLTMHFAKLPKGKILVGWAEETPF